MRDERPYVYVTLSEMKTKLYGNPYMKSKEKKPVDLPDLSVIKIDRSKNKRGRGYKDGSLKAKKCKYLEIVVCDALEFEILDDKKSRKKYGIMVNHFNDINDFFIPIETLRNYYWKGGGDLLSLMIYSGDVESFKKPSNTITNMNKGMYLCGGGNDLERVAEVIRSY